MNKALLLMALWLPLFSSGLWGDPPPKISMVTLEDEAAITAEIASLISDASLPKFADHYPLTASLRQWIKEHRAGATSESLPVGKSSNDLLLMVTAFDPNQDAERLVVSATGRAFSWLEIYRHAARQRHWDDLAPKRFLEVIEALQELPEENEYPPESKLVLVSFHQDDQWVTHTFSTTTVQNLLSLLKLRDHGPQYFLVPPLPRPSYPKIEIPMGVRDLNVPIPFE